MQELELLGSLEEELEELDELDELLEEELLELVDIGNSFAIPCARDISR